MSDLIERSRHRLGSGLGFSLQYWSFHSTQSFGNVVRSAIPGGEARGREARLGGGGEEQSVLVCVAFKAHFVGSMGVIGPFSVSHSANVN